jgi:hypothetical protein
MLKTHFFQSIYLWRQELFTFTIIYIYIYIQIIKMFCQNLIQQNTYQD